MSGQYSLPVPGGGVVRRSNGPGSDVPPVPGDTYRSPFALAGHTTSFVWSKRAAPLAHILKDNTLPLIVKISDEANVRTDGEDTMDFRQPLLLYREHQVARLYARNVVSSSAGRKEAGPFVVIPQNYPGYFRRSGQPGKPITSVSTLARLMPASILSLTACDGYVCVSSKESDVIYQKTSLEPGHYVIKDLLEDQIAVGGGGGQKSKKKLVRCLRCVSESSKKVVLFPLKTSGQFYVASTADSGGHGGRHGVVVDSASRVYRWTELTSQPPGAASTGPNNSNNNNNHCDITAVLVHGKPPPQQCKFTGTLAFKHVSRDHTVIGCTTAEATSQPPRLLELSPSQKGPNFVLALNQDCFDIPDSPLAQCLNFVKREFERYVTGMKVRRDYEVDCSELRESST